MYRVSRLLQEFIDSSIVGWEYAVTCAKCGEYCDNGVYNMRCTTCKAINAAVVARDAIADFAWSAFCQQWVALAFMPLVEDEDFIKFARTNGR